MGAIEDITLFEKRLNELVIKYEHYFLGLEKRPPLKLLEEVESLSRRYTAANLANTMLTFRYNSIKARLASYKQHWQKTLHLMEEGKYSRDRFKMQIHENAGHQQPESAEPEGTPGDVYQQFLDARRECGLAVEGITREMVAGLVEQHKAAALAKYNCKEVELRIAVEDGKPKLKIRPKK